MIRRASRAVALAAVVSIGGAAVASASAPDDGEQWAVDTSDCPDPDAVNAPIEGEVVVGSVMPLSGPVAAAYQPVAQAMQAYVDYANANELLPGYTIRLQVEDDQYNPANTPAAVESLLDEGAHFVTAMIGTGSVEAVRDTLGEECVPLINVATGDPRWGDEAEDYPWLTGALIPYDLETRAYAEDIVANTPDATVALFSTNSAFGEAFAEGFTAAADEAGLEIVAEEAIDATDESPPSAALNAFAESEAGVIVAAPLGVQCINFLNELAAVKAANTGWEPVVYMTTTCAASALIMGVAGANGEGVLTVTTGPDITDPEVAAQSPVAEYIALMNAAGLGDIITTGLAGWSFAETTVHQLQQAAASPDGLTRASIINAARNMNYHPMFALEGVNSITNGMDDTFQAETMYMTRWLASENHYEQTGAVYDYETSTDAGPPATAAPLVVAAMPGAGASTPPGGGSAAPVTTAG
ncbi:ABC transporter substrate-binding protein [Desertimonas flava]|uniref:ABC transporter substrate-binding protein n=1 Tax=Desertimonas flava TaxID=2064846 RepID=UPI0013C43DAE|nr:ABC transporter substrate-binding protein [Desertimonas flava]